MKRFLLATAAVIALAVAAPIATAQYTTPPPATAPYTTPVPDDSMTPQDQSVTRLPDATATQSQSQLTTPATPTTPMPTTTAQTDAGATAQGYDQSYSAQAQAGTDAYASGQTDTYASSSTMGENMATPASLEQHARDAGMDHLPMSAQEVCMPREISLTSSGTRLNRDKQHQLIDATDRASVCAIQRVVIHSPNGRAEQARQLLVDHGVDASKIEVQDADMGGLAVDMNFAGLATSNEQYAQIFSTQQYASYQPAAPGYAPSTTAPAPSYGPSTTAPDTTAPGPTYEPSPSAPPVEEPTTPDNLSADPNGMDNDPMSPTSGEPLASPGLYDI
jgi:hypothetical protein